MKTGLNPLTSKSSNIQEKLSEIEKTLQDPISPQVFFRLFHKLDRTSSDLQKIKKQTEKTASVFQQSQKLYLEELEKKIIELYGNAIDKKIAYQIEQIDKESTNLENAITSGSSTKVKREYKILSKHITTLLQEHCISRDNFRVIARAKQLLALAKEILDENKKKPINTSLPETTFESIEDRGYNLQEMESLIEIVSLLQKADLPKAKEQYLCVSSDLKSLIEEKCKKKNQVLFENLNDSMKILLEISFQLSFEEEILFDMEEVELFMNADLSNSIE